LNSAALFSISQNGKNFLVKLRTPASTLAEITNPISTQPEAEIPFINTTELRFWQQSRQAAPRREGEPCLARLV
jgi:hypothetical protein